MLPLTHQQYHLVEPQLQHMEHHSVLKTILSGETPGYIYVDSKKNPAVVFVQFKHRAFISGDPDALDPNDLINFIQNTVSTNCLNAGVPLIRLSSDDPKWLDWIETKFQPFNPIRTGYRCFRYQIDEIIEDIHIPQGFSIKPVDHSLIQTDFIGKDGLLEEMCSERESVIAFLAKSFGVVAFAEGQLAGWCLSEYNTKQQCEVGIASLPPFQQRGLATAMTQVFLNDAHHHGIRTVYWHCYESNVASQRTALKAGFSLISKEDVLILYVNQAHEAGANA